VNTVNDLKACVAAAKRGELDALRGYADLLRERNEPAESDYDVGDQEAAYYVEAAYYELTLAHAQARQLRRMLELVGPTFDHAQQAFPRRASPGNINSLLSQYGLPCKAWQRSMFTKMRTAHVANTLFTLTNKTGRKGWSQRSGLFITCPTDGVDEDKTGEQLAEFVALFFPRTRFIVEFRNYGETQAAGAGLNILGLAPG
jgi:hypothetical protein